MGFSPVRPSPIDSSPNCQPYGKLLSQFSPHSNPIYQSNTNKRGPNTRFSPLSLAEKMGFEPMLRYKRTTPLAGEPLEPLGYFSNRLSFDFWRLYARYLALLGNSTQVAKLC